MGSIKFQEFSMQEWEEVNGGGASISELNSLIYKQENMKRKILFLLLITFFPLFSSGQNKKTHSGTISCSKEYSFIMKDSPAVLSTMKQFNQNYLSLYRLSVNELNKTFSPKTSSLIQIGLSLFTIPLTHEEGHRSVLTVNNIGSVANPFFNKNLAAYVKGVSDQTLIQLRDNNLPTYIRLHTAGLESDYSLLLSESSLLNWEKEDFEVLGIEFMMRKINLIAYYFTVAINSDIKLKEEADELERDIVGHDIYGAIRHLHRPDMPFFRYTQSKDLTHEELKFAKRVGWRSLFNLIDPLLFGKTGWVLKNGYRINASLGYGMSPFGDYIDENIWLKGKHFNSHIYFRQHQNKNRWFPAMGINTSDIHITGQLKSAFALHGWMQPEELRFNTSNSFFGGALDCKLQYKFLLRNPTRLSALSADLGIIAKSKGFMAGEAKLDSHIGLYAGLSVFIK